MGIVLSLSTHVVYTFISRFNKTVGVFIGTFMGITAATITHIFILVFSDIANLNTLLFTLVPFYLFIGIIEGFATAFIVQFIEEIKPEILKIKKI